MNTVVLTAAAGFAALLGLFGAHHATPAVSASSTAPVMHAEQMMRDRVASSSASMATSADIACAGSAVAARESALDTAISAETSVIASAYDTRASALTSAYTGSDAAAIRASAKAAWSGFASSTKPARVGWRNAQENAWSTFKTAIRSCGGSAVAVSDAGNATLDSGSDGGAN